MRTTILFGNGLGMAIDPFHFNLGVAMKTTWKSSNVLSPTHRELISACLPQNRQTGPETEADLEILQEVTAACQLLKNVETPHYHWLSAHGHSFPESVNYFTWLVAQTICNFSIVPDDTAEAWKSFSGALVRFCTEHHPHMMTLNYDDLLEAIVTRANSTNTIYKDGFKNGRFSEADLFRTPKEKSCAFHLKLHGSPAIYTARDNSVRRSGRNQKAATPLKSEHLILSHVSKKEALIERSSILPIYWNMLRVAMRESNKIIVIGYSGNDRHLNQIIASFSNLQRTVVEWVGSGTHKVRVDFWQKELGGTIEYVQLENILDFNDW